MVDEMRSHSTEWLCRERDELVHRQRTLRTREPAVLRVLDERGKVDVTVGSGGDSARTLREKVETARALEPLQEIGAVACAGGFSDAQLGEVVKLADEESDAEWARRAPNIDPADLARLARKATKPSSEDSRARYEARSLRMWWTSDKAMLHVRGQLPDVIGAEFEATITKLTESMRPSKGRTWDSFEHRAADALFALCGASDAGDDTPALAPRPVLQVHVPLCGPAEIAGVPIADSLLEQVRANATIEPVVVEDGEVIAVGRRAPALSPKIDRAVLLRDGQCRMPGCARRRGLEVHHLVPRSEGGTDEIANLAAVCASHHRLLVPHGRRALVGNPNVPDGLALVDVTERAPP